jgi:hypothetical protein
MRDRTISRIAVSLRTPGIRPALAARVSGAVQGDQVQVRYPLLLFVRVSNCKRRAPAEQARPNVRLQRKFWLATR